jgi:outer membrane protein TolC
MTTQQTNQGIRWGLAVCAVVAGWLAMPAAVFGQSGGCPVDEPLTRSAVGEAARAVFERGPGRRGEREIAGLEEAGEDVPDRFRSLEGAIAPEFRTDGDAATNEYTASVALGVSLGRLSRARREAIEAEAAARRAERDRRRVEFVYRVQQTYLDWWVATVEKRHLAACEKDVREELKPLEEAAEGDRVTSLNMADFDVEAGRISAQRAEAERQASMARADLREMLGASCRLAVPDTDLREGPDDGPPAPPVDPEENPWLVLLERVDEFPGVRALLAEHERAVKAAAAAEAEAPPELSAGVGARSVGFEDFWAVPELGVTIPLGNPSAPEVERQRGLAAGLSAERRWRIERTRAEIHAAASRWEATLEARRKFVETYLAPLRERDRLFEQALERGRIELERVVRAKRALHRAEHDLLVLDAEMMARSLRARALLELIRDDQ